MRSALPSFLTWGFTRFFTAVSRPSLGLVCPPIPPTSALITVTVIFIIHDDKIVRFIPCGKS